MRVLILIVAALVGGQDVVSPLESTGRLGHPPIREASGIVQSRRHPGVFWVHNDSGNPPSLFAVRRDGTLIREYAVGALNIDWEDIASDDRGHLYLGEIGNNGGRLPLRAIYRIDEPNPSIPTVGALPVTAAWYYRFPAAGRFDAEGLYIDGDRAVVVAKTFDGSEAELFALPLGTPSPLLQPSLPESLGTLPGFKEPVTAADLSPDGRRLAVGSNRVARVYGRIDDGPWTLLGVVRFEADGIEAICWEGSDLILAGEGRGLYRIKEAAWKRSGR